MNTLEPINVKYWELLFSASELGHKGGLDYSSKCPICGDSKKKKNLKRCHLFTKPTWDHDVVHCFNCGWKGNMYSLLETVSPTLYNSYKNERRSTSLDLLKPKEQEVRQDFKVDVSFFDNLRELPPALFELPTQFEYITKGDEFYEYIKSRGLTDEQINMFRKCNTDIVYNNQRVALVGYIILPLWCNDKVYGFQARSIKDKKFYTFIPEENHGYKVWNWFNVDVTQPVYVFESYFDALSSGLTNIVAQLGATLSEDRLKEVKEVIFVLDNQFVDPTARTESIKYAKRGHKVMIWPKGIKYKDFNDMLKKGADVIKIASFIKKHIEQGLTAEVKLKI